MATTAASLQVFVGADINQAIKGLNSVSKSVSSFTSDVAKSAIGFGIATVGLDAFGSAADLIRKASGVGLARDYEDVNAQLTAMLGSADQAAAMMAVIRERADATPFGFLELSKAAAGLVPIMKRTGAPLDEMLNTILALASFDPVQGLEGAGIAFREFASGDTQSLKRRFEIDTAPIEKLIDKGVPGLKALQQVLGQSGIDLKLVEARAKSTGGRLNTFQDLLGSISIEAGKPILAAFGVELDRASGLITANLPKLKEFASTIGTRIGGAINTLGGELGTVFQTATNIAAVHDVPFLDALAIAAESRIGELFGKDAQDQANGFVGAIRGLPELLEKAGAFLQTDWAKTFEPLTKAIEGVQKTFGLFVIDLAKVPGIGENFTESAAHFRQQLGVEGAAAAAAPLPLNVQRATGVVQPGSLADLFQRLDPRSAFGTSAGDQNIFNLDLSGLDPRSPTDALEIGRRLAELWARTRRTTANAAPAGAPGE